MLSLLCPTVAQQLTCNHVKTFYQEHACCDTPETSISSSECTLLDRPTYHADMQLFQDTLRQHLALQNPRPLEHISRFQDEDEHVMYGYTAKIVNQGKNIIVGGPSNNDAKYADKDVYHHGKIVIWENLFDTGKWVKQGVIEAPDTVPSDAFKDGYGRYVTSSDDATLIAQNSWMGGAPADKSGYATLEHRLPSGENQASLPVSALSYTTTGPSNDLLVSGLDGTYTVANGLLPGNQYGDTAIAIPIPELQWVIDYKGGSINVETKDGKVHSVTLSGFDTDWYYQSELDAMVAAGSPIQFAEPSYKYETVFIMAKSYNIHVSRDGSTFAHWTFDDSGYSFYIRSYDSASKTNTLLHTFAFASCGGWKPITMSSNGDTVITSCDGSVPFRFDKNGTTYDQTPLHERTKMKWVNGPNGWVQQALPYIHAQVINLEMSYDDTTLIVGDRKDQIVEVYTYDGSSKFVLDSTIRGNTGNFAGGHSGIALSDDNKFIAVTARKTQVSGVDWKGSAYLYEKKDDAWKRVATIPTDLSGKVTMFGNTIDLKYNKLIVSAINMFQEDRGGFVDMYNILEHV